MKGASMGLKRYGHQVKFNPSLQRNIVDMFEHPNGTYCRYPDVEDLEQKYKDLLMVMEEQYIPRPDPEEVRKAVNKVKRLVKTQCKSFRRHGLTEEIAEAEKELLRLMGVQDGR